MGLFQKAKEKLRSIDDYIQEEPRRTKLENFAFRTVFVGGLIFALLPVRDYIGEKIEERKFIQRVYVEQQEKLRYPDFRKKAKEYMLERYVDDFQEYESHRGPYFKDTVAKFILVEIDRNPFSNEITKRRWREVNLRYDFDCKTVRVVNEKIFKEYDILKEKLRKEQEEHERKLGKAQPHYEKGAKHIKDGKFEKGLGEYGKGFDIMKEE